MTSQMLAAVVNLRLRQRSYVQRAWQLKPVNEVCALLHDGTSTEKANSADSWSNNCFASKRSRCEHLEQQVALDHAVLSRQRRWRSLR